jgi:hypothetical protein
VRWESELKLINGKRERNYYIGERLLCNLEEKTLILFPRNMPTYLRSMQSIGLMDIHEDVSDIEANPPDEEYKFLMEKYRLIACDGMIDKDNFRSRVIKGRIDYTEFGLFFLAACVNENPQEGVDAHRTVGLSRKSTKRLKETLVLDPEQKKAPGKPLPEVFEDTQYLLVRGIEYLADQAHIPSDRNYAKPAKVLRDMKIISRSDYSVLQDFWTIAAELSAGVGVDEDSLVFAVKSANEFLEKHKIPAAK